MRIDTLNEEYRPWDWIPRAEQVGDDGGQAEGLDALGERQGMGIDVQSHGECACELMVFGPGDTAEQKASELVDERTKR